MSKIFKIRRRDRYVGSYCGCSFPKSPEMSTFNGNIHSLVTCKCGENDCDELVWRWDVTNSSDSCSINGRDVTFHPIYSQGTSFIRGDQRLEPGKIHYWEIKTITIPSGTDMMFGIGTDKVDVNEYEFHFTSGLGLDDQSWGYSYRGAKHHGAMKKSYSPKLTQGCIIGIYVDLYMGYMEFFVNRSSYGIAFYDIPHDENTKLYPMVCSTAAKSAIRLLNSTTVESTLQYKAYRKLVRRKCLLQELKEIPGLVSFRKNYWFVEHIMQYKSLHGFEGVSLEDEAILPQRWRRKAFKYTEEESDTDEDIYENASKIVARTNSDSDDEDENDLFSVCFNLL